MDGNGWGWMAGGLMMLIFWGGLVALVVFLVRGFGARSPQSEEKRSGPDAEEILAERFARGETRRTNSTNGGECWNRTATRARRSPRMPSASPNGFRGRPAATTRAR